MSTRKKANGTLGGKRPSTATKTSGIQAVRELVEKTQQRLSSTLPLEAVDACVAAAAKKKGNLAFMWPGHSGYAWSNRIVVAVMAINAGAKIIVRVRRGTSYRNGGVTPAVWPELRGFPGGDITPKLKRWGAAKDALSVSVRSARALRVSPSAEVELSIWNLRELDTERRAVTSPGALLEDPKSARVVALKTNSSRLLGLALRAADRHVRGMARLNPACREDVVLKFIEDARLHAGRARAALLDDASATAVEGRYALDAWFGHKSKTVRDALREAGVFNETRAEFLKKLESIAAGDESVATREDVDVALAWGAHAPLALLLNHPLITAEEAIELLRFPGPSMAAERVPRPSLLPLALPTATRMIKRPQLGSSATFVTCVVDLVPWLWRQREEASVQLARALFSAAGTHPDLRRELSAFFGAAVEAAA